MTIKTLTGQVASCSVEGCDAISGPAPDQAHALDWLRFHRIEHEAAGVDTTAEPAFEPVTLYVAVCDDAACAGRRGGAAWESNPHADEADAAAVLAEHESGDPAHTGGEG